MRWLLHTCILIAAAFVIHSAGAQTADRSGALERQVKAAYLYKFASYIEWPDGAFAHADSPLVIGVIGADALAEELEHIVAGRTVSNKSINVRRLRRGDSVEGLHVLFIGQLDKGPLADILSATKGLPILTVTDSSEAYALGSMINFVIADDKLRFEVALKPVGPSGLKISARMLVAAYKVAPAAS